VIHGREPVPSDQVHGVPGVRIEGTGGHEECPGSGEARNREQQARWVQAAVVASPWRIPTTWTARRTRSLYSPAKQAIPSSANRRLTRSGSNVPHRQAPAFTRRRAAANATHHWVRRATLKQRGGPAGLFKRVNSQEPGPVITRELCDLVEFVN